MKPIKTFRIGSSYFFENKFDDYKKKDNDYLAVMDSFIPNEKANLLNVKIKDDDIFICRPNMTREDWLDDTLNSGVPIRAGKFLVPEVSSYFGITIDDLKLFENLYEQVDDRHKYEQQIYKYYIENNDFKLTDEQLNNVYKIYKEYRDY